IQDVRCYRRRHPDHRFQSSFQWRPRRLFLCARRSRWKVIVEIPCGRPRGFGPDDIFVERETVRGSRGREFDFRFRAEIATPQRHKGTKITKKAAIGNSLIAAFFVTFLSLWCLDLLDDRRWCDFGDGSLAALLHDEIEFAAENREDGLNARLTK